MSKRGWATGLFLGLLLAASTNAGAADNYKLVNGLEEFYYGHISLVDLKNDGKDPMVLREGAAAAEPARLNLPLGPGDTIFTSGERRCEIQFDNGTVLRLDVNTELKIEALMAQSLSARTKISNLVLRRGRAYVMYKEYNSKEMFQIMTANAAVKLAHNSVTTVGWTADAGTEVLLDNGRANVLYGPDGKNLSEKAVYKSQRLIIAPNQTAAFSQISASSEFAGWNLDVNKSFDALHKGKTMVPKPVQRLNAAVFYFAQQYGNLYGDWIYDDFFGYVWRPSMNDARYPNGGWSPYKVGQWTSYNGQMFWVADEPWGWIPFHLGIWHWDAKRGWYWLPGSAFAPAWVDWAFFAGDCYGWRPWSMWDWGWYDSTGFLYKYIASSYFASGLYTYDFYGFNFWNWRLGGAYANTDHYDFDLGFPTGGPGQEPRREVVDIHKDIYAAPPPAPQIFQMEKKQLEKRSASPFAMPKEFKSGLRSLLGALKNGDETAVGSLLAVSGQALVVGGSDLRGGGIHNRAVRLDHFLEAARFLPTNSPQKIILSVPPQSAPNSASNASRAFDRGIRAASFLSGAQNRDLVPGGGAGNAPVSGLDSKSTAADLHKSAVRARDWNPDVSIVLKAGLDIKYLSQRNEISIPQLRISSSMTGGGPVLGTDGRVRQGGRDSSGSGGGSSSGATYASGGSYGARGGSLGAGGSTSDGAATSAGSSSGGSSSGSSSSGGGHIRN